NVLATQRLLESLLGHDIRRVVLASSSSVYGNVQTFPISEECRCQPVSPYGATKVAMESVATAYFQQHDLPIVSLRYFTVYGPRQRPDMAFARFIRAALAGETLNVYGDGRQQRDFTYVTDAVAATISAAHNGRPG